MFFSIITCRKTQKPLVVSSFLFIFAEDKLHSAICKQAYIALVCIIFAEDKLHSAICKQAYIALVCIIFATDKTIIYMS
jgi:uncharacterized MnhB-related membrane protein